MDPSTFDPLLDSLLCTSCGRAATGNRRSPLCPKCRARLAARRVPGWLKISIAVLLVPVVLGAVHVPATFAAGIAFERGRRAEARGDFQVAAQEYANASRQLPDSTLSLARKAIAAFRAGQLDVAAAAVDALAGRPMAPDLACEVNAVIEQLGSAGK